MFELFLREGTGNGALIESGSLIRVLNDVRRELTKSMSYYHTQNKFVDNKHVLVRLLKQLPGPLTANVLSWYNTVDDNIGRLYSNFGLLGDVNARASVIPGTFTTGTVGEILFDFRQPRDYTRPLLDWIKETPSIVVFHHGHRDIIPLPLLGDLPATSMDDYSVVGIDTALLFCQYHLWKNEREVADTPAPIAVFLANGPLVQAMQSFNDVSILNIYSSIAAHESLPKPQGMRFPQGYIDHSGNLASAISEHVTRIKRARLGYTDILKNLPMLFDSTAYTQSRLPNMMVSRQARWIYLITRLQHLLLLSRPDGIVTGPADRIYSEDWRLGLKFLISDRVATLPSTNGIEAKIIQLTGYVA